MNSISIPLPIMSPCCWRACAGSQSGSAYSTFANPGRNARPHGCRRIGAHRHHRRHAVRRRRRCGRRDRRRCRQQRRSGQGLHGRLGSRRGGRRRRRPGHRGRARKKDGLEITIKLDSGQIIAVTQEADEQLSRRRTSARAFGQRRHAGLALSQRRRAAPAQSQPEGFACCGQGWRNIRRSSRRTAVRHPPHRHPVSRARILGRRESPAPTSGRKRCLWSSAGAVREPRTRAGIRPGPCPGGALAPSARETPWRRRP
jgi:hypothetical protein